MSSGLHPLPRVTVAVILLAIVALLATGIGIQQVSGKSKHNQTGEIYAIQGAFHGALTAGNPDDVDQRIENMLALWTEDGMLTLGPNTFSGKGVPGTASCAPGSGTLCDFFTNINPAFQNEWVSLAPSYRTKIDVHGKEASLQFECHFFDLSWTPTLRIAADATVVRSHGQWKLSSVLGNPIPAPGIPYSGN
ncbi:MAG: hypothetical protein AB7J35_02010 [Dehalococcoidia bacterium]